jgi:HK97 family phage major capsid protein
MSDDLSAELRAYLVDALYAHPAEFRRNAHWVMNPEWFSECRRMTDTDGRPLWEPSMECLYPEGPLMLLGKLIEVREDGGAPHLEAATAAVVS